MTSSSRLTLFIIFVAVVSTTAASHIDFDDSGNNDLLIRQVVPHHSRHSRHLFESFKKRFGKSYSTEKEDDYRFAIFKSNMELARSNQKKDPTAVHGVTQFSDLTFLEFHSRFFSRVPLDGLPHNRAPILPTTDLPNDFDWRDHHGAVKESSSCGSSWLCSISGALEGAEFMVTRNMSHQRISAECKSKLGNLSAVSLRDEHQIAANLFYNGPLAVVVNQVFGQTYVKGISCPKVCSVSAMTSVFHQPGLLVGYGHAPSTQTQESKKQLYWIIKNSYGQSWGENGYYRVCQAANLCRRKSMLSSVAAPPTLEAQTLCSRYIEV